MNHRDIKICSHTIVKQALTLELAIDSAIWHHHNSESVYDIDILNMGLILVFEYGGFRFRTKVRRRMFIYIHLILSELTSV